jgi:hypothetical protein
VNAPARFVMAQPKSTSPRLGKMPRAELAQFLSQLSELYSDPRTGNHRLSVALLELSHQLSQPKQAPKRRPTASIPSLPLDRHVQPVWLRGLDIEGVRRFISDNARSKSQLIELASERFSIPQSRLERQTAQGVREEILSALMHEESIQVISQEAERGGKKRV